MVFVACGINHKTSSLELREKVALTLSNQAEFLQKLVTHPYINEAALLSTCNRTEIYCDTSKPDTLFQWLTAQEQTIANFFAMEPYFYCDDLGIRHLLKVATGLDSMMLGEPQILGQMKQAYHRACEIGAIKQKLQPIFQHVFAASKRIRCQSGISNNPISIAYAGVQLISQHFNDLATLKVFLIGSGETCRLVAKYLYKQGVRHFLVASRTQENAQQLANDFNATVVSAIDIPQYLGQADVIVSATTCPLPFINKHLVEQALIQRQYQPLFFLDLALPRDIEAEVGQLEQITLYNLDDLQYQIDQGLKKRQQAALIAERLIDEEIAKYLRWQRSLKAKQTICNYRDYLQSLALVELERAKKKLELGIGNQQVLEEFSQRLINKFSHHTTLGLKQAAFDNREDLFELIHYLFNFSGKPYERIIKNQIAANV